MMRHPHDIRMAAVRENGIAWIQTGFRRVVKRELGPSPSLGFATEPNESQVVPISLHRAWDTSKLIRGEGRLSVRTIAFGPARLTLPLHGRALESQP